MADNYERTIKAHDTGPAMKATIRRASDGKPQDLTGSTIRFLMYDVDGVELVNAPASAELPTTSGAMRYDWIDGDTDVIGRHRALFEVVLASGQKESYPSDGYIWITIQADLNAE